MRTYIDCGAGVAGDMLLSAQIGLGLSVSELQDMLARSIPIKGWKLRIQKTERRMWPAWSLRVDRDRSFTSITQMLRIFQRAPVPKPVRQDAIRILKSLKQAEAQAHGHAHGLFDPKGLGRIDTLVDILGNAWGFWRLGIRAVVASPVNTGRIAPATRALLSRHRVPVYSNSPHQELATPTGVAILTHYARQFLPLKRIVIVNAGYGAGTLERQDRPNVLAIYQGK